MRTKLIAPVLAAVLALGGVACGESATTGDGSGQTGIEQDDGSGGSLEGSGSNDSGSGNGGSDGSSSSDF